MDLKKETLEDLEYVVFDTETTGIHTISAWPVEIAGVRMCGTFLTDRCYSSLCRPDVIVTPEVTAIHGISDDDVRDAPSPMEAIDGFFEWAGAPAVFVAHNAQFDLGILATAYRRAQRKPPAGLIVLDTLVIAQKLLSAPSHSLDTLTRIIGEARNFEVPLMGGSEPDCIGEKAVMHELGNSHRALPDSLRTAILWRFLATTYGEDKTIADMETDLGTRVTADFPQQIINFPRGEAGFEAPRNLWMIEDAIENDRDVMIEYGGGESGPHARKIRPVSMYGQGGKFYIEGFCYIAGFVKTFRLDKIMKVWEG